MLVKKVDTVIKYDKLKYALKWISLSILIGFIVGIIALLFQIALMSLINWVNSLYIWIILCLPIMGLFISGIITGRFAPEARGHGTDAIINAYHEKWGIVRPRVIGAKLSSSIVTLGFGGSAGREGPTVQMGGGFSSFIGQKLSLTLKEQRTLVLCGMSASFGAIFGTPLSGALFACEVVYRDDFEYLNILPCAISSVVGFLTYKEIFSIIFGSPENLIQFPTINYMFLWWHIIIFLGVGFFCGLIGLLYVKLFYYTDEKTKNWKRPEWFKTLLGGIIVTLLAILFVIFAISFTGDINNSALILGLGWRIINLLGTDPLVFSLQFLILLLIFKILTTCATIGSGGSGGVVAPSIVIGALVGGIIATILGPFVNFDTRVFIGVSSIVMFASIAHIPLTGMLMAGEIFGISFIIPTLLASTMGSWVAAGDSIYHSSLISRDEKMKIYHKFKEVT
ncbi:MAG: chloride channel protein [Promethearchaeota archaeon]